jgi:acetylornithine deacetylase
VVRRLRRRRSAPSLSLAASGGVDAIDRALHLLGALRELEAEWNAEKAAHPPFDTLARPVVIYAGQIEGGDWASSVPAWCRLRVRVGFYPGWEREEVAARLTARIGEWAARDEFLARFPPRVEPVGQYGEGYVLQGADEALAVLSRHHAEVAGGELARIASGGSSDARILGLDGRTSAVLYGPRGRDYHGYDEAVELESVLQVTQTLALFIAEWCRV